MLIIHDDYPPVAFLAGLPDGIQLAQLPNPQNVHKAMVAPGADKWVVTMGKEMANLKAHDVYKLVPCKPGMHTL